MLFRSLWGCMSRDASSSYTLVNRPVALVASIPFLAPDPTRSTIIDDFLVVRSAIAVVYRVFLLNVFLDFSDVLMLYS